MYEPPCDQVCKQGAAKEFGLRVWGIAGDHDSNLTRAWRVLLCYIGSILQSLAQEVITSPKDYIAVLGYAGHFLNSILRGGISIAEIIPV